MKIIFFLGMMISYALMWFVSNQESGGNPHGDIRFDCAECHSEESWHINPDSLKFNHSKTGFPLIGVHAVTYCRDCHSSLVFDHIGVACIDCHEDVHKGELGFTCENCHVPQTWENRQDMFETHSETRFPLIGVHAVVDCEACHHTLDPFEYKTTPLECTGCHSDEFQAAENPDHQLAQFSLDCEICHSIAAVSWQQATYTHPPSFVLRGTHIQTECNACHTNTYAGTPNRCEDCHMEAYNASTDPSHVAFGFPTDCAHCHNESRWDDAIFDHLTESGFELRGAHASIQCVSCHINNQLTGLPRDCYGCHQNDYLAVNDPNHTTAQFSHDCLECHSESAWSPSTFDHNQTQFPLSGAHASVSCASCHINGQFSGTPSDCWSCHEDDYLAVTDPNHVTAQFSHDCLECHTDQAWSPSTFDHNQTQFPLSGAHTSIACASCHINGQFSGTPTDCWSCHEDDYLAVTDPNHVTAQFSHDCLECHTDQAWSPSTFDHNQTQFPLSGAHTSVSCTSCHINGQFSGTPSDCWSCHENDYQAVTDPNHVTAQFSHDCLTCHTDQAWSPATFNHDQTQFPLTGAHVSVNCQECHINGQYTGLPSDCYSCHETEYNNTNDPNHMAAGFPVQCENCHNTTRWDDTTWDHDNQYFPIYSGRHQGAWDFCADCHIAPTDYKQFECIFCHEHSNQTDLAAKHSEENDYVYQSSACYDCHPRGLAEND